MKRISFLEYDTEHLYELALEHFQKGCYDCERIKKRQEKFLGDSSTRRIKRLNKKHPYYELRAV